MFTNKKGFTLIELLVVVLIIGILAAIAVPKYQKAVIKSKYSNLKNITTAIYRAEQSYYLANNSYTDTFDKLDISISGEDHGSWILFDNDKMCSISLEYSYLYCKDLKINMSYFIYFNGIRACLLYSEDPITDQICKNETGKQEQDIGGGYKYPSSI